MTEMNNAAGNNGAEGIVTETVVVPGPIGRLVRAVVQHPVKCAAKVAAVGAAGAGIYYGYRYIRNGGSIDQAVAAAEGAASTVEAALRRVA